MPLTNLQQIVELAKARGFVYQGSEIYGGLANAWDYGPYGSMMKENIKNLWIKEFVQKRENMTLLDAAILMNPQVWVASGHVGGFSDPLMDCKSCKTRHRADKLIEGNDEINPEGLEVTAFISKIYEIIDNGKTHFLNIDNPSESPFQFYSLMMKNKNSDITKKMEIIINSFEKEENSGLKMIPTKCPNCSEIHSFTEIRQFNLMFKTFQGVTEDSTNVVYLRPETAQGIFVNFANIARTSRKKVPFGVAQVGKAFRNEITPGNFIFRTREFEQMEIEYFCEPEKSIETHTEWKEACYNFLINKIGLKPTSLKKRDHEADELSHYSSATTDIEFMFPFGWGELWGIAHRGDFDLKAHMKESKADLSYFDPVNNKKYIPHVIEPSVGLTRLFLATLCDAYTEQEIQGEEGTTIRTYLKLDPKIAPVKVGVLPVVKKIGDDARAIFKQLTEDFVCEYDEAGSVGKRYARFDEIGTPFCVTIDSDNYAAGNVTVRHRDSMEQEIVAIVELNEWIGKRVK